MKGGFLHTLSMEDLVRWLSEQQEPVFRAKQIVEWLWKRSVDDVSEMTNIGKSLQRKLADSFVLRPVDLVERYDSEDEETTKFLWKLTQKSPDGEQRAVESVLIRAPGRKTVCVSSQVGCPVGCTFCASGKNGFIRNLDAAEIVSQVLGVQRVSGEKISHIVFMGMGEPLKNYDAVVSSVRLLCDPMFLGISRRRITISTVGIVENIRRLAVEDVGVNLALSLHAPTQEIRQKIIPFARKYELSDVLQAVDFYREHTGRDVTYEYILISGVNDSVDDARALSKLLRGRPGSVNLIPYNSVSGVPFARPSTSDISKFRACLEDSGIPNTCRYTKGDDIAAACGQLALGTGKKESIDGI